MSGEFVNSSVEFADDLEELEEDLPFDEFDDEYEGDVYQPPPPPLPRPSSVPQVAPPRPAVFAPTPAPVLPAPKVLAGFADQLRLQNIKSYGRSPSRGPCPASGRARSSRSWSGS